jgi:hypothetical protein
MPQLIPYISSFRFRFVSSQLRQRAEKNVTKLGYITVLKVVTQNSVHVEKLIYNTQLQWNSG